MQVSLRDRKRQRFLTNSLAFLLAFLLCLGCATPTSAQDKKKQKNQDRSEGKTTLPALPLTDEQQIDILISTMLGAWQIGDVEKLHSTYADDVSVVNGEWAPPVIGWSSFLAAYQLQRSRMDQVRLDRSNTYIRVLGNFAWSCYQWEFSATVDGRPDHAYGQTTLILQKRDNHWLIVHNHTSLAQAPQRAPASTPATTPQSNGPGGR
jgi:uncharacterized protein (TIGR02246 family)